MADAALSGAEFKKQLREGKPKLGLFINSHSPTVVEQLAYSGYDWLLVDTQHGPMDSRKTFRHARAASRNGGAKSMVRVGGISRPPRHPAGARHGRGRRAHSLHQYRGRSAPGRELRPLSHGRHALGLFSAAQHEQGRPARLRRQLRTTNVIVALQVETASCIENIAEIAAVPGVDILFLGQNDLCMSMGLYEKYEFPHMYTSPELGAATQKLVDSGEKNNVILGLFLFGTSRVGEFLEKGFTFISIGNDLHHVLTQAGAYVKDMENISKEKGKAWKRRTTALF